MALKTIIIMKKSFKNASGYEIELGHAYCEKKRVQNTRENPKT